MGFAHHLRFVVSLRLEDERASHPPHDRRVFATWEVDNDRYPEMPTVHLSELCFMHALRSRQIEMEFKQDAYSVHRGTELGAGTVSRAKAERIALGSQVFLALMPSERIRHRLVEAITTGADLVRIGIRLNDAALEEVPWELSRDPELGCLALLEGVSIVRLGDPAQQAQPIGNLGPIHVRYVDAGGIDHVHLLPKERWPNHEALKAVWSDDGASTREWVSWREVSNELLPVPGGPNIFHFTGHGKPAGDGEDVSLMLSGRDASGSNRVDYLGLDRLGQVLSRGEICLAVLSACDAGVDVTWRAMGAGLLRWIPAVLSMQGKVDDTAADEFCEELYVRLGVGESLDEAVAAGRRRLRSRKSPLVDWWLPVLHTTASEPIRFAAHPAVQGRMGAPAASRTPSRMHRAPSGRELPVGAQGDRLWVPPAVGEADDRVRITANGDHCAVRRATGDIEAGRRSGRRVEWKKLVAVSPDTELLAFHVGEYGNRTVLVRSRDTTLELHVHDGLSANGDRWVGRRALAAAWTGSGFTCVDQDGRPFGNEKTHPLPLPNEAIRSLDAAVGAGERLAAWTEGRDLVLCRTILGAPEGEERRRITLDHKPDELIVARSGPDDPPRAAFVRVAGELHGWSWDRVA